LKSEVARLKNLAFGAIRKADAFSGSQSHRGRSQKPRSKDGSQEGQPNELKPIDRVVLGTASESPGRNESERETGLEKVRPQEPSLPNAGEGSTGRD
jgi:hypothetical protein